MKIKLLILLFTLIYLSNTERLGDFFEANIPNIRKDPVENLVKLGETFLNNNPNENVYKKILYESRFGVVVQFTFRKGSTFIHPALPHAEYTRVVVGKAILVSSGKRYILNPKDGILFPGNLTYSLSNDNSSHLTTISIDSPIKSVDLKSYKPYQYNKDEILETNLNLGKLFIFDQDEVDLNQIGERLRRQGQRLVSAPLGINRGVSGTMYDTL
jgi:hypothetical protein